MWTLAAMYFCYGYAINMFLAWYPKFLQAERGYSLAEMGFFGILVPEDYGGLGLGLFEYCLVTEELARAWMSVASPLAAGR